MSDIDYKTIFDLSPLPIFVLQDGFFRLVNPKMCEITGYTEEELLNTPYVELIHPEDLPMVMEYLSLQLAGGIQKSDEFRGITRGGNIVYIRGAFTLITFNGAPAILGQVKDITGQKRVEEKLLKSEEKYHLLLESIEDGYYEVDLEGTFLQCNDAAARNYGVADRELLIGTNYRDYMDDEIADTIFRAYNKVFRTGRPEKGVILNITRKDGIKRILEVSVSSVFTGGDSSGKTAGFRGIARDITERQLAEEKLLLNEARLEALLKLDQMTSATQKDISDFSLEEGVRLTGSSAGFLAFANEDETVLTMHSWSINAMRECAIEDKVFVYPVDGTGLWGEAIRQRRPVIINDYSLPSPLKKGYPEGHVHLRRVMCVPVFDRDKIVVVAGVANKKDDYDHSDADQLVLLMSGMWRILQRRRAEETLRSLEERFSKAFNTSPVSMAIQEYPSWRYLDVNERFLTSSGYSREEVIGRTPVELKILAKSGSAAAIVRKMKEKGSIRELEFEFCMKSGQVRTGLLTVERFELGGAECLLTSFYDITERKLMEEQLKYLSLHDTLTGLYNRAYFEEEMRRLEKGRRSGVGIIVCDVDGLKHVNDTEGHGAGDALLVAASRVIRESFRGCDMVSRIGGDEFAILLPDCDRNTLEGACRRIRSAIARYNEANPGPPLSISVGFSLGDAPSSPGDIFREADNNMYREKLHRSQSVRSALVQTLMKTLEVRDFVTDGHADRMQRLVSSMAGSIGLPDHKIADLCIFAQFHDIGKVGIPDSILFKQGPLTPGETVEMRRHCEIGHLIAISPPDLVPVADWILKHHEWWNGQGYPMGLKGEEIPVECRILAIADAYDAMTNDRPYRKAMSHQEAVEELKRCAGIQFDPRLVPLFIETLKSLNYGK